MERFPRFLLALLIGGLGGMLFSILRLPLAWMLGAMTFCTMAAIARMPILGIEQLRPPVIAMIAVALGAGFRPELLQHAPGSLPMLAGLTLFIAGSAAISVLYFQLIGGYDLPTALFAGMPGGLAEMTAMGADFGADVQKIALSHASRVFFIVMSVPYLLHAFTDRELSSIILLQPGLSEVGFQGVLWFMGCVVAGLLAGRLIRLPASDFFVPLVLTAALQMTGVATFQTPQELIVIAQLMLGVLIGCGFAGADPFLILKTMALALGATILILSLTVVFTLGLWLFADRAVSSQEPAGGAPGR